jgi:ABC-type multidrug transport system permease subunit
MDSGMNDWLHNLPVVWMALLVFGITYLVAAAIYALVTLLSVGERTRSFKAISPGLLPPVGIIFGLFVAFKHQPPSDLALIATKASLVVRNDLHPAIQYLLLNAATEIHSGQKIFHRANQFPAPEAVDTP